MSDPISIYIILDGSGSMSGVNDDVNGGVNQFLKDQREFDSGDGDAFITLTVFDTNIVKMYVDEPIADVEDVDRAVTLLGGMTALLDAVGKTLSEANSVKKPGKKLVLIYTDGFENASKEWKLEGVKKLIKDLEDTGEWTFTFMSAGVDNFAQASAMGIASGNYAYVANTGAATADNMARMSAGTTGLRTNSVKGTNAFYSELAPETNVTLDSTNVPVTLDSRKKKSKSQK
jgi:uncharacterized protein YegL